MHNLFKPIKALTLVGTFVLTTPFLACVGGDSPSSCYYHATDTGVTPSETNKKPNMFTYMDIGNFCEDFTGSDRAMALGSSNPIWVGTVLCVAQFSNTEAFTILEISQNALTADTNTDSYFAYAEYWPSHDRTLTDAFEDYFHKLSSEDRLCPDAELVGVLYDPDSSEISPGHPYRWASICWDPQTNALSVWNQSSGLKKSEMLKRWHNIHPVLD